MEEKSYTRKSVHGEMICRICSDLLREPKLLACAHSFCKECLISLQKNCRSPSTGLQYEMDSDASDNYCCEEENRDSLSNKIECPDCFQVTVLPDKSLVGGLSTHSQLEETIGSLLPEEKEAVRERIGHRNKLIIDIKEGRAEFCHELCTLHELQHKYFCTDCNVTVCVECVSNLHSLHQFTEISTFLVESFYQLQSLVQPACEYASRADASLKKLGQDRGSIEFNRNACKEAIFEVFNKIREEIDERQKRLLNSVDRYVDQKLLQVNYHQKNLEEVQDQLYERVQEIQQILDSLIPDITLVLDKQRLIDDVDIQEQNILDIESSLSSSMFSSTYIGFRDDDTQVIKKQIDMLITLCEFYPDADTGYYSSRTIPIESEESLYVDAKLPMISDRNRSSTCTKIVEDETLEIFPTVFMADIHEAQVPSVKRSLSTPTASTKEKWLMKKRTSVPSDKAPSIPIRYDSLILPAPIINPDRIFNKLTVSKTETVYPCGICLGENNSYVITDVKNHCLRIIASNGKFIGAIGKEGKGSGQFEEPCAVAINEKAQVFVCQRENSRVQKFTSGGKYIQKFGHKSLRGNNLGEPWGIAIAPNKKIYVTDWDRSCIHSFYSNGHYDCTIGNDDSILGESLKFPAGIAVDASGNLIVADRGNHCVWILETNGSILMRIGSKGHGPGELFLPHGVAVHTNGSIVVSESGNNRVSIFSPHGKFLKHFGRRGSEPGMFEHPRHVCLTPKGEIVVADEQNQRLQLFNVTI